MSTGSSPCLPSTSATGSSGDAVTHLLAPDERLDIAGAARPRAWHALEHEQRIIGGANVGNERTRSQEDRAMNEIRREHRFVRPGEGISRRTVAREVLRGG